MLHISLTGIEPRKWSFLFSVAVQARKLARDARSAPGCLSAGVFRKNNRLFVYTVWEGKVQAKFFEGAPVFAGHMATLTDHASLADTHAFVCRTMPAHRHLVDMWNSARYVLAA